MLIYLIRHGQTKGNLKKTFHGRIETKLTKKGFKQAKQIASFLENKKIACIYCSSMKRAVQTAEIISEKLGVPVEKSDNLKEVDFGIIDGLTHEEAWKKHPLLMEKRARDKFDFVVSKGESYAIAQKRAIKLLQRILKKHKGKPIAIVAHECINRTIIGYLLKKEPTWMMGLIHPHEYVYLIDTKKKTIHNISTKDGSIKKGTISAT